MESTEEELMELNGLSMIMGEVYRIIDTDVTARQKKELIWNDKLLVEKGGDLMPVELTQKEKYLKIFQIYLDLVME